MDQGGAILGDLDKMICGSSCVEREDLAGNSKFFKILNSGEANAWEKICSSWRDQRRPILII